VFFFYIVDNRIDALYGNPKEITEGVVQAVRMAMLRQYSAGVVCGVNWFLAMALSIIHTGEKMYAKVEYV
jgi:C4-dicarboxylate-specific signal transduction histidine kinase